MTHLGARRTQSNLDLTVREREESSTTHHESRSTKRKAVIRILKYKPSLAKKTSSKRNSSSDNQALPWIEIEEDDAIYNTSLKRVRYRSHEYEDNNNADISFKQWETIKLRHIKAGTLEKLVDHLTPPVSDAECDPGFFLAFLCTYKSFSTTSDVVDLLIKRFEKYHKINQGLLPNEEAVGIMKRICSVFIVWLDQYPMDFDEPTSYPVMNKVISFANQHTYFPPAKEVLNRYESKLTMFSVSPFADENPLKFKFCSCLSVIGCTCEKKPRKDLSIRSFSAEEIAEQLTIVDSELFVRVVPRESLACFWSKRDISKGAMAPSIKLTVDQFNAVSLKVVSTILNATDVKSQQHSSFARSKVISKWIDVALELRSLKNFSSLKAILSGLQTTPIYRLNASWELVPKNSIAIFEELAEIFSDDLNSKASRDLLMQEGTAKYSSNSLGKAKSKRESLMKEGVTHGTVPYLGTFLTDLMFIDTAHPDKVKNNLINFEKRRKEFEVVIQIKLLQQASKNYSIPSIEEFFLWFNSLEIYGDKDGYEKSLEVEPSRRSTTPQPSRKPSVSMKRYASESDLIKYDGTNSLTRSISALSINKLYKHEGFSSLRKSPKVSSLSSRNLLDANFSEEQDGVVVRVYLEDAVNVQYKSIKIFPNHRACDIIVATLRKFKSDEQFADFSLYQILANKKFLHIPMNSNMYYAMRKCNELVFKVSRKKLSKKARKKRELEKIPLSPTFDKNFEVTEEVAYETLPNLHCIAVKSFSHL